MVLVEDNPGDAEILIDVVRTSKIEAEVNWVKSLADALHLLEGDDRCDCVLLDLGLPDTDGLEGLTAVRSTRPDLPVVVLTGRADNDPMAQRAIRLGAQDYLNKIDLDDHVVERTLNYAIERAGQQSALRAANAELDRFASAIAHDLKNPISVISGFAELLDARAESLDDDSREWVRKILLNSERATAMINELLTYGKQLASGTARTAVDLNKVLEWAIETVSHRVVETGTLVEGSQLPVVWANEAAMRRVFTCLLDNAIKYCDSERPIVHVEAVEFGDGWRVSVSDNGMGIPEADRERAMEAGVRLTPHVAVGSGLGLASCAEVVRCHGGVMRITDSPLGGVTVSFTLAGPPVPRQA